MTDIDDYYVGPIGGPAQPNLLINDYSDVECVTEYVAGRVPHLGEHNLDVFLEVVHGRYAFEIEGERMGNSRLVAISIADGSRELWDWSRLKAEIAAADPHGILTDHDKQDIAHGLSGRCHWNKDRGLGPVSADAPKENPPDDDEAGEGAE